MSLLGRLRAAIRARHYSPRTEESYAGWVRRFVVFHGRRHPATLGEPEVQAFLTHLAERDRVSASTQNQALAALLFLYEAVLGRRLALSASGVVHAKEPHVLPVVLSRDEVRAVLGKLSGISRLVGLLLYGSGMRLLECLRLRVKDVDFHRGEIRVRRGRAGWTGWSRCRWRSSRHWPSIWRCGRGVTLERWRAVGAGVLQGEAVVSGNRR